MRLLQLLLGAKVGGVATCLLAAVGRPSSNNLMAGDFDVFKRLNFSVCPSDIL